MRTIAVSTEVFSAIWAKRQEGEETEDDVLRRILDCGGPAANRSNGASPKRQGGYHSSWFDVRFDEGFEIFRTYKGTEFRAQATGGRWLLLNDNRTYPSLHKLSWAVVHGRENAWTNWKYRRTDGKVGMIDEFRDESKINRRQT